MTAEEQNIEQIREVGAEPPEQPDGLTRADSYRLVPTRTDPYEPIRTNTDQYRP